MTDRHKTVIKQDMQSAVKRLTNLKSMCILVASKWMFTTWYNYIYI